MQRIFICIILGLCMASCDFFEDSVKLSKGRCNRLAGDLDNNNWSELKNYCSENFKFISANGKSYQNKKGKPRGFKYYKKSITVIKGRITLDQRIVKAVKVGDTVKINCSLVSETQNGSNRALVTWKTQQQWKKMQNKWVLTEVKDMSKKTKTKIEDPDIVARKKAKKKANKKAVRSPTTHQAAAEIQSGIDYGTGATSLRTKQKITRKLDKIQEEQRNRRP
ncbi:MAG: hypothetical protein HRT89_08535 [Lentisphaeria bacterium]|nr:hypothetical protein [Lentisphaeria bacterium]NQZ68103.1 hypothetical protein [Lentisphaeria bacterium]